MSFRSCRKVATSSVGQLLQRKPVQFELRCATNHSWNISTNDATVDRGPPSSSISEQHSSNSSAPSQPLPHLSYHPSRQCLLNAHLILDYREIWPSHPANLGCPGYGYLPIHCRCHWHSGRFKSADSEGRDRVYLHIHLFLCLDLVSWCLGRYRRNISLAYSLAWCGALYRFQLSLELHHSCHYPYIVDPDKGNLKAKVFFIWGTLCAYCLLYAYLLVPETKGLSLEQVDRMLEETTSRTSAGWVPKSTFATQIGLDDKGVLSSEVVEDVQRKGSAVCCE
jgi:hypothetical protein